MQDGTAAAASSVTDVTCAGAASAPSLIELEQRQFDAIALSVPGGAGNIQDIYPLSPLQEGMLFHHLLDQQRDPYVLSALFELQAAEYVTLLVGALQQVVDRHDILRSAVLWQDLPRPIQVVHRRATLSLERVEVDPSADTAGYLRARMRPGRAPLDLRRAPVMALQVTQPGHDGTVHALLRVHHIICDHQSLRAVLTEALSIVDGRGQQLPAAAPYRDYLAHTLAAQRDTETALGFFRDTLADVDEPTAPFGILSVRGDGNDLEEARCLLDPRLSQRVRQAGQQVGVSPARMMHAAWALVMAATSARDDIVFGTVVLASQQKRVHGQRMLGMSVNTLPLRLRLLDVTAAQLVEQTDHALTAVVRCEHVPLPLAQGCSRVAPGEPLFTALLNYRRSDRDREPISARAGAVRVLARGEAWTSYPLALTIDDLGEDFQLTAQAVAAVGAERVLSYLARSLDSLVDALTHAPRTPALHLAVLPDAERMQVIEGFNPTHAPYPQEATIERLYAQQLRRSPHARAAVCGAEALTYSELDAKSEMLARFLRASGVGPDVLVGMCLERGVEVLIALLGIWKAGGAYVPLDPAHPIERLAFILEDAAPRLLLTQSRLRGRLPPARVQVVTLDADSGTLEAASESPTASAGSADDLAYVIYTSGSTGQPKGVMIERRHVMNLWQGLERIYDAAAGCRHVALNASLNFDASVQQLVQLLSGRTIFIVPEPVRRDATLLLEFLQEQEIDAIDCTPSQLRTWIAAGLLQRQLALRLVLVGGEAIDAELWDTLARCRHIEFYNVYGPTECTVDATVAHLNGDTSPPHIGHPMLNRRVYVLDCRGGPAPVGVVGEIHIGGAGIARSYLHRPQLSAERFMLDPFGAAPGSRMYRTGDLGRWRADGRIEYLGRNDTQVKVRGYRIELGEIEAHLLRHAQVADAAVIAREDQPGDKRLVAYVVPATGDAPSVAGLRAHVLRSMPEYMVPGAFVLLDMLPLTSSGKLNRRALPVPGAVAYVSRDYEPPDGEIEEILGGVWQRLLRIEHIGRHDNFFELGGHSLMIVQMMEQLRGLGLWAELRRVYDSRTLADLARALTDEGLAPIEVPPNLIPAGCCAISPSMLPLVELQPQHIECIARRVPGGAANIQDIYPLAPLQEGILFHHLRSEGGDAYVRPLLLEVASRARLQQLIAALQTVINRHDVLRTAVLWEQLPRPVQVVMRKATLSVSQVSLDADRDLDAQVREWLKPERQHLDLAAAPLLRLRVAQSTRGAHLYALLQSHHIIGDYTSQEIVTAEIRAVLAGQQQQLPEPVPYREHVARALAYARGSDAEKFFRRKFADVEETTAPFGLTDVNGDGSEMRDAQAELASAMAKRLREQARLCSVSAATLFHAAWSLVVAKTSGRDDVVFGTVLLGRLQTSAGAQRTPGMFINTLPLRLQLEGLAARELVERTQRGLVELLGHEQASLAVAQRCSAVAGSTPLFTTLLNYRHRAAGAATEWRGVEGIRLVASQDRTNYPVVMSVDDLGAGFGLSAQTEQRIDPQRLIGYLQQAIESLLAALEQSLADPVLALSVLPPAERYELIESYNATRRDYPDDRSIHQLFEEQVRRGPAATAVLCEGESLTYGELNDQANRLARQLQRWGTTAGDYVPIVMVRSLRMLVVQLAVLKNGAAYVPVDPELPPERRAFIIRDCAPRLVVVDDPASVDSKVDVQWVDGVRAEREAEVESAENPGASVAPTAPAYVMYTSGSTGTPKGVVVPHRAVNRLAINNGYADITPADCIPHYSNPAFDASTFEVWGALLNGARLLIVPPRVVLEGAAFASLLMQHDVSILWITVGLFNRYTEVLADVYARLRYLLVGGDCLEPNAVRKVLQQSAPQFLLNAYGPTECTTFSTTHVVDVAATHAAIPIGRPIANARIYILDRRVEPVAVGVAGEMYIGGAGVACGYLNRPELTAARFVPDRFAADQQARMYRTGDLARWRSDGTIEFLGRNDQQVKVRGFRVELSEIEVQLARHPHVQQNAVVVREDRAGEKTLVAYVRLAEGSDTGPEHLRAHLRSVLPQYMIPGAFVVLSQLPLSPSGKVNRRALPAPDAVACQSGAHEAAQGPMEERLAAIWRDVLDVQRIGRRDNFFDLGGHSLVALQALTQITQSCRCALTINDLYRHPTVAELAAHIASGTTEEGCIDLSHEATLDSGIVAVPGRVGSPAGAVLLTGATGFVGRFLLAQLLQDTEAIVYCLVRAQPQQAASRLRSVLMRWDLWREDIEARVIAVAGDLRLPRLGLEASVDRNLCRTVDAIYHCGTSMNHLETYSMAKAANVDSARCLVAIAAHDRPKVINYISTLSVFAAQPGETRFVNELTPIDREKHLRSSGYAASKWVGERIFMTAAAQGLACNIFRLGLVWPDSQLGRYDELQREYRIIKTCLLSGCGIIDYPLSIAPLPVDHAARAIVGLAQCHPEGGGLFHISSGAAPPIGALGRCIEGAGPAMDMMPYYDWMGRVRQLHRQGVALPAVPLIQWAFSLDRKTFSERQREARSVRFDCARTQRELERIGITAPGVDDTLVEKCIRDMLKRDEELRELADPQDSLPLVQPGGGLQVDLRGLHG